MSPGTLQMSAEVDITPTKEETTSGATSLVINGTAASKAPAANPKVIGNSRAAASLKPRVSNAAEMSPLRTLATGARIDWINVIEAADADVYPYDSTRIVGSHVEWNALQKLYKRNPIADSHAAREHPEVDRQNLPHQEV
jgi:hypothetical protein